jgi:hypothetical protein
LEPTWFNNGSKPYGPPETVRKMTAANCIGFNFLARGDGMNVNVNGNFVSMQVSNKNNYVLSCTTT